MPFNSQKKIRTKYFFHQTGIVSVIAAAVILPVLLLMFVIGTEIVGYFRAKQQLHLALERELEILSRNLSNRDAGEKLLISRLSRELSTLGIKVESSGIIWQTTVPPEATLKLRGHYSLFFTSAPILLELLQTATLPINANVTIQLASISAAFIVDTTPAVAPINEDDSLTSNWAEGGINVGASWFNVAPTLYYNNQIVSPSYLSLRCFNSKLSPIKRATITLIDLLQYFGGSRYYLAFLSDRPSDYSSLDVSSVANSSSDTFSGGLSYPITTRNLGDYPSGSFNPYISFFGRDVWCAAAATSEQLHTDLFSLPTPPNLASAWKIVGRQTQNILSSLNPPYFSPDYLNNAPLREQVWFRAASEQENPSNWAALSRCTDVLLETTNYIKPPTYDLKRDITRKVLFIITNRLPINNSSLLADYRSAISLISQKALILNEKLTVSFILVAPTSSVLEQINSFKEQTAATTNPNNLNLEISHVEGGPEDRESQLISILTKMRRMVRYREW